MTKPRRMRYAGHVAHMGEQKILMRKRERNYYEDLDVGGRIIIK
jgi:hypothetical protein